jgi:ATP-dependent DNA ligase
MVNAPPVPVFEVEYRQRLKDGLRRAVLKGLRPDKRRSDLVTFAIWPRPFIA